MAAEKYCSGAFLPGDGYFPIQKVGIRCKKYLTAIKFIIHFFSIYVHRCTLIICLSITHQTEMTEKHRKITVTNGYKNKIVGK
uniref:hypothetical protein n=1 Tax=Alistipes shahii TaxID=328814 RepID=UPI003FEE604D